mmetsp:Transcript_38300/g.88419  ORF Transcript_38300/g.88419 Transcript_38300/m.88419 type:complete len:297 (+) Transcript_38300:139-1029(+)
MFSMALALLTVGVVPSLLSATAAPECRPFKEIYASGKELCEVMWNNAFKYETNEEDAYTMWFFDMMNNPNDATSAHLALHADNASPNECKLQYFHKEAPTPEGDGFTECHPWKQSSCCASTVVESYIHLKEAYGAEYHWDRCGPLSQECERFFVQEACFYECEPNAGYYKKYVNGTDESGEENHWQMYQMPIKASYCDAWYIACADDLFCGNGDYFECANIYETLDQASSSSSSSDDDGMGGGVIVVIICGGVLLLLSCVILGFFVARERAGRPVFAPLMEKQASPGGQPIGNSVA